MTEKKTARKKTALTAPDNFMIVWNDDETTKALTAGTAKKAATRKRRTVQVKRA